MKQKQFFDDMEKRTDEFWANAECKATEKNYWKQVWKIVRLQMFLGIILAAMLAAIICSIDFTWRLFS